MFDQLFYKAILSYKASSKKRAHNKISSLAAHYVALVQIAILFVVIIIFMKITGKNIFSFLNDYSYWIIAVIFYFVLYLFNAVYYNGKRMLKIKNANTKDKKEGLPLWKLWLIPFSIILLSIILLQAA